MAIGVQLTAEYRAYFLLPSERTALMKVKDIPSNSASGIGLIDNDINALLDKVDNLSFHIGELVKQIGTKREVIGKLEAELIELRKQKESTSTGYGVAAVVNSVFTYAGPITTVVGAALGIMGPISAPVVGFICGAGAVVTGITTYYSRESSSHKDSLDNIKNAERNLNNFKIDPINITRLELEESLCLSKIFSIFEKNCENSAQKEELQGKVEEILKFSKYRIEYLNAIINSESSYCDKLNEERTSIKNGLDKSDPLRTIPGIASGAAREVKYSSVLLKNN